MKINIQKLARAIPCFLAVLSVALACSISASAAVQQTINPYNYITEVQQYGSIEKVTCFFMDIEPENRLVIDGQASYQSGRVSATIGHDVDQFTITSFLTGVNAFPDQSMSSDCIDISAIMAGATLNLESTFGFWWSHSSSDIGTNVSVYYTGSLYCYDKRGNYISCVSGETQAFSEQVVQGSVVQKGITYNFVVPDGCAFISPFVEFTVYADVTVNEGDTPLQFFYEADPFKMKFTRDAVASDSQLNQEIADRLDDIMNGNDSDNQNAQNGADRGDSLAGDLNQAGDALDSVPKPNVNINDMIPSDLASESYLNLTYVIGELWKTEVIARMMSILGCFLFLSFLLYGKKG